MAEVKVTDEKRFGRVIVEIEHGDGMTHRAGVLTEKDVDDFIAWLNGK